MFYETQHYLRMYNHDNNEALLDFAVLDKEKTIIMASMVGTPTLISNIEAALQNIKTGVIYPATDVEKSNHVYNNTVFSLRKKKSYVVEKQVINDFEHLIVISKQIDPDPKERKEYEDAYEQAVRAETTLPEKPRALRDLIIAFDGQLEKRVYDTLTKKYRTPMQEEWSTYIYNELIKRNLLVEFDTLVFDEDRPIRVAELNVNEKDLERIITDGIQSMQIVFADYEFDPNDEDKLSVVHTTSDYIRLFPSELTKVIQKNLRVRFDATKDLHSNLFKQLNLHANEQGITGYYPPQANAIMGAAKTLKEENFCFVVGEMGTGKSGIGAAIPAITSGVEIQKGKRTDKREVQEDYVAPFRAIVLSPNIIVDKWVREIENRVPNAKVRVIHSYKDILKLYKENAIRLPNGKVKFKKPTGIEYYIMSSELPKVSIPEVPESTYRFDKAEALETLELPRSEHKYVKLEKVQGYNATTQRQVISYRVAPEGNYCPHCGKPIMHKKKLSGKNFFSKFNATKKEFKHKQTTDNHYCKGEVETKYLPKEMIKEWRYDPNLGRKVPAATVQQCGYNFWGPEHNLSAGKRKVSPAWLINKKFPRGFFKYLIADEVHEYASGTSSRATGFGQLVNHTEKQILLTGTLFGGMARDIFYLLARLAPEKLAVEGMDFHKVNLFNKKYGVMESTTKYVERENGLSRKKTENLKPGINPHLFPLYLMNNAVFLELADLADALPEYSEVPIIVQMDSEHQKAYDDFSERFMERIRTNKALQGLSAISRYINVMYQYADAPYNFGPVSVYDEEGKLHEICTPQKFDAGFVPKKLQALLDTLDVEIENGRKNLVYVKYTGDSSRTRMDTWLYDQLRERGYNVGILCNKSSYDGITMPKKSGEREKWLNKVMEEHNWDVLITNPRLVKVGLDLLQFPNIHFYQLDYSTFDFMQASRRSWRIGQTQPVKVFTYVNGHTIQEKVLKHLARKIDASLAIQGKFSEEGLRAMSESSGGINDIAKELINGDALNDVETIYDIFRRKNKSFEDMQSKEFEDYPNYTMNPIEGGIQRIREIARERINNVVQKSRKKVKEGKRTVEEHSFIQTSLETYFDHLEEILSTVDIEEANKGVPKSKRVTEGQLELDLFAL